MDAAVILAGIERKKFNKDEPAKKAFCDSVEEIIEAGCENPRAKEVTSRRPSLVDKSAAEVQFTVVLEELVDEGADYATVSNTLFESIKEDLAASVEDATLEAALANVAAASGSAPLADVEVDVEASVAALEDATSTFEVAAVGETAAPSPKIDAEQTPAPVASPGKQEKGKQGKKPKGKKKKGKKKKKAKGKKKKKKKKKKKAKGKKKKAKGKKKKKSKGAKK